MVVMTEASSYFLIATQHVVKPNEGPMKLDLQMQTTCDNVIQWLVAGRWFSADTLVSSTTEMLLSVWLSTITLTLAPDTKRLYIKYILFINF